MKRKCRKKIIIVVIKPISSSKKTFMSQPESKVMFLNNIFNSFNSNQDIKKLDSKTIPDRSKQAVNPFSVYG